MKSSGRALLLLGWLAQGCGAGAVPAAVTPQIEPEQARGAWALIPAEAEVVMVADVTQLRGSEWTRPAIDARPADERAARTAARGFDEIDDVDQMAVARLPTTPEGTSLTVLVGRFSPARVASAVAQRWPAAVTSEFRGATIWTDQDQAQALVDGTTLIDGPTASVRAAVDCVRGRADSAATTAWLLDTRRALGQGRGRSSLLPAIEVAVSLTPEMRARLQQELGEGQALQRIGARLDLGPSLELTMVGATTGRQQAVDMTARLEDLRRQLGRRRSMVALGISELLGALRLSAQGARVVADLRLSEEQRDQIAQRLARVALVFTQPRKDEPRREALPPGQLP